MDILPKATNQLFKQKTQNQHQNDIESVEKSPALKISVPYMVAPSATIYQLYQEPLDQVIHKIPP